MSRSLRLLAMPTDYANGSANFSELSRKSSNEILSSDPWRSHGYANEQEAFRSIVESPWYGWHSPNMRIARSVEDEVETTARGFRRATSVYGTLTELAGDIFIIDDPQKPVDA
jgi:hypothetical protein